MTLHLPYEASGQQLGETRQAMTKAVMENIEKIANQCKHKKHKFYVLVHGKPYPNDRFMIKMKYLCMDRKPPMMLSCMLFGLDNSKGIMTLEWALPGDWPTWAVGGTNDPIPETIASINQSGIKYHYDSLLPH